MSAEIEWTFRQAGVRKRIWAQSGLSLRQLCPALSLKAGKAMEAGSPQKAHP